MRVPKGCPLCRNDVFGTLETDFYCRNCNLMMSKRHVRFRHLRIELQQRIRFHFSERQTESPKRTRSSPPREQSGRADAQRSTTTDEQWIPLEHPEKAGVKKRSGEKKRKTERSASEDTKQAQAPKKSRTKSTRSTEKRTRSKERSTGKEQTSGAKHQTKSSKRAPLEELL